jgi:hypothetical protein
MGEEKEESEEKQISFTYQTDHYEITTKDITYFIEIEHVNNKINEIRITSFFERAKLSANALKVILELLKGGAYSL